MIEVKHLTKRFGAITALDDISFQVDSGSIFGLVGSNGAGKSTFLRTAAGVYRPDAGSVLIDGGEPFENLSVKGNVCFISDYPYFPRAATLTDMEDLFSHTYPHWDKERFHYLCSCFPLDTKQRILNMSKGMQRQAAILCALGARPTHLLLDEIFDGLDPVMRQLLKRILSGEVSDRGMTVVIASHNLRELEDICDHVGLFHRGGVIFDRELDSLKLGISRVQAMFRPMPDRSAFDSFDLVTLRTQGSLVDFVARGTQEDILAKLSAMNPVFSELLPLTLEEVFISEMEAAGYDIDNILS
ncbi:ABC transporter ATP-binding protein [Anaeromassilibacillus sp. An200]|uniref:ABC transporter ATP-binding protein n=1 Tax=Candidatus Caccousia stercoris TaxID=2840723 RepID=A0A9D1FUZ7_9FIRM|nr:ABC transporter ATP-binding protein [Anaeromassilibacillus sp. An200]OUP12330.1 ABC transporter [Anaeromassilibacillus sp. An200]HIS79755.1 ABC transporter ATP-binding protein [Candidatus Caccousia stercoris]